MPFIALHGRRRVGEAVMCRNHPRAPWQSVERNIIPSVCTETPATWSTRCSGVKLKAISITNEHATGRVCRQCVRVTLGSRTEQKLLSFMSWCWWLILLMLSLSACVVRSAVKRECQDWPERGVCGISWILTSPLGPFTWLASAIQRSARLGTGQDGQVA